ncbi:ANK_REP_REGION domain-containing protein [Trichonephila clavata]|uniref:ANK_REP_REGION domain-containing protein n=1 Tax=Trichonephila clavata TaxID=2740835 RepID=A0A8X6JEE8_TRICU|nr:ANK_REP_REGION domain-containing protein [Trichonephila clavata]
MSTLRLLGPIGHLECLTLSVPQNPNILAGSLGEINSNVGNLSLLDISKALPLVSSTLGGREVYFVDKYIKYLSHVTLDEYKDGLIVVMMPSSFCEGSLTWDDVINEKIKSHSWPRECNDGSGSGANISSGNLKLKEHLDVISVENPDIAQLRINERQNDYRLDFVACDEKDEVISVKVDGFEKLVIQTKKVGITKAIKIENKSLPDIIKDMAYQKLSHAGADIGRKIVENSEKRSKAVIIADITGSENTTAYAVSIDTKLYISDLSQWVILNSDSDEEQSTNLVHFQAVGQNLGLGLNIHYFSMLNKVRGVYDVSVASPWDQPRHHSSRKLLATDLVINLNSSRQDVPENSLQNDEIGYNKEGVTSGASKPSSWINVLLIPYVIVVGGQKGGTGKTTIATNIATMRTIEGRDVYLYDLDPQSSALLWSSRRAENTDLPAVKSSQMVFDKRTINIGAVIENELKNLRGKHQDIIVDAGGADSEEFRAALLLADLVIFPIGPSACDMWTLPTLSELVSGAENCP